MCADDDVVTPQHHVEQRDVQRVEQRVEHQVAHHAEHRDVHDDAVIDWVVLTRGDRPDALAAAVESLAASPTTGSIVIVVNGPEHAPEPHPSTGPAPGASTDDTDPASTDPASTDPASADPASADPASADPASADPASTVSDSTVSANPTLDSHYEVELERVQRMVERLASRATIRVIGSAENLGVPGGRDLGLRATDAALVGFLDDDARLIADSIDTVVHRFATDPGLGAVSLRLVDEAGNTSRRHVPRRGAGGVDRSGPVATFLGGASILRRRAYDQAGGYWSDLMYGHEELDLAWRLTEHDSSIWYDADIHVFHPRTAISRHADGWWRTGRNRVLVARRNLPLPLLAVHSVAWMVIGTFRAPSGTCRRGYITGWFGAWRTPVERAPLSWSALGRLRRLGRFPII